MIALLLAAAVGQWGHSATQDPIQLLSNYRPASMPTALGSAKCVRAFVGRRAVRGYWAIESEWEIRKPLPEVVKGLLKEMKTNLDPSSLEPSSLERRGSVDLYRVHSDRKLRIWALGGHEVPINAGAGNKGWDMRDKALYTTLRITESPRLVGPLPETWPASALHADPLPKTLKPLPFKGISETPTAWAGTSTMSAGPRAGMHYGRTWVVKEDPSTLFPRLLKELKASGDWYVPPDPGFPGINCRPKRSGLGFLWIELDYRRDPDSEIPSKGWSVIHAS